MVKVLVRIPQLSRFRLCLEDSNECVNILNGKCLKRHALRIALEKERQEIFYINFLPVPALFRPLAKSYAPFKFAEGRAASNPIRSVYWVGNFWTTFPHV